MKPAIDPLRQWVIYPPALAAVVGAVLLAGTLLRWLGSSPASQAAIVLGLLIATWWLLPRLAFKLWRDGDALCWRWGQLHHGPAGRVAFADIRAVHVASLPDRPKRPVRRQAGVEIHGGNFTPELNRGVRIELVDGRQFWFGLPQAAPFAAALRAAARLPKEDHAETGTGQQ